MLVYIFFKNHFILNLIKADRREFNEAPIPGYRGYVPKVRPTDIGLGVRYHDASERGLNAFKNDYLRNKTAPPTLARSQSFSSSK